MLLALCSSLFSCGGKTTGGDSAKSVEEIPLPAYKRGQKVILNVYNWGEYISDGSEDSYDTNLEFEKYFNENTYPRS